MDSVADRATQTIDFAAVFGTLSNADSPAVSLEMGGQSVRLVAFSGAGGWHKHEAASETVIVWDGVFDVEYRDHTVRLGAGQCTVIAAGQEHRGVSGRGARIVLLRAAAAG